MAWIQPWPPTVAAAQARSASGPRAIGCDLVRKPDTGEAPSRRRAGPSRGPPHPALPLEPPAHSAWLRALTPGGPARPRHLGTSGF